MNIISKRKLKFNIRYFLLIFFIFPIICWCFKELTYYGTDFGVYYSGSYFLSDDYSLYSEHFTHKGPFFYFFIKIIGNLIGWGTTQYLITLFLALMIFYVPLFFTIDKFCNTLFAKITMLLISISLLFGQNSNSSIAFFQEGLIITSILPILFNKFKLKDIIFANILFSLAIFTRIDSLIFAPIFFIYFIRAIKGKKEIKKFLIIVLFLFIPILIFSFFSSFFNFTLYDFYESNITFNSWYKENYFANSQNIFIATFEYFKRPTAFLFSNRSLITPLMGAIILAVVSKWKQSFVFNINLLTKKIIQKTFFIIYRINISWVFGTLSVVGFILTNSDRNYHSLIFTCPLCFLIILNFNDLLKNFSPLLFAFPIYLIYLYSFICGKGLYSLYKAQDYIFPYNKTIEYIKQNDISPEIVGGRGWPYFIVKKQPIRAINDWWLYSLKEPYTTKSLKKQHNELFEKEKGYIFWIDNKLSESHQDNPLLKEIKSRSIKIEDQGYYSMYKLK